MQLSTLELYTIGIGPSSSHTVGPMRAARQFRRTYEEACGSKRPGNLEVTVYGSLAYTGKGHGTDKAIVAGLENKEPETINPQQMQQRFDEISAKGKLAFTGGTIPFDIKQDLHFDRKERHSQHSNALRFRAFINQQCVLEKQYLSIGGGFIIEPTQLPTSNSQLPTSSSQLPTSNFQLPAPFHSAKELVELCERHQKRISELVLENEKACHPTRRIYNHLDAVWKTMQESVKAGYQGSGPLPGGLNIARRAPSLYRKLQERPESGLADHLTIMDWVNLYAIAVNEENAAGGRVVTAPTNGAAGVIPAVMHYAERFCHPREKNWHRSFLLTAAAIGILFKENASISGADVGCQGEVGVACSMAAGALAEFHGGTPRQIENAAEIGMEHNLGLTCDPVGGLVQIPCIERNAMGAIKAINAARLALRGEGHHHVSLDAVIKTMRDTGRDMRRKYKETSRGGLAVNVTEC